MDILNYLFGSEGFCYVRTLLYSIFTTGFGLLESGSVSVKNELNIMVKNAVDVVFGGLTYWIFGYGLSFGDHEYSNPFVGWGGFFVNADEDKLGVVYSKFFFQASFATTATTIVSGKLSSRQSLSELLNVSVSFNCRCHVRNERIFSSILNLLQVNQN